MGKAIGSERLGDLYKPGPLGERMWQWYQDFKNTVMRKD